MRAERERQAQIARSQTQATDATGNALSQGTLPPDTTLVVRNGVVTLAANRTAEQLSAATVDNKVAILILEFFDRHGVTVRKGDLRRTVPQKLEQFGPLVAPSTDAPTAAPAAA